MVIIVRKLRKKKVRGLPYTEHDKLPSTFYDKLNSLTPKERSQRSLIVARMRENPLEVKKARIEL